MKNKLRLTDLPFIIFSGAFVSIMCLYIFTGVNMLPSPEGAEGSRWIALIVLVVLSGIVCMFGRD